MNIELEGFNEINPKELEELHEAIAKYKANAQFRQENEFCALFLFICTTTLMPLIQTINLSPFKTIES